MSGLFSAIGALFWHDEGVDSLNAFDGLMQVPAEHNAFGALPDYSVVPDVPVLNSSPMSFSDDSGLYL